ncbi:hyaluronan synthase [Cellulosimicrobium aquatile]|uniref:Hyaluronan synthase n=1 Tax=Cellulosimicrobium aquatile TaxID=1612203 RepID=A0A1N6SNB7_9MICO|nr:glycosyltransferase [Cellulosimicrobium aquatile]SIQ42521.1 hyaluronan synthase [Cellulosimicrobium aquatile]
MSDVRRPPSSHHEVVVEGGMLSGDQDDAPAPGVSARWETGRAARIGVFTCLAVITSACWVSIDHVFASTAPVLAVWLFLALLVTAQLVVSQFATPFTVDAATADELHKLRVVVLVPCYNEDPRLLEQGVRSMIAQTRPPDAISVIDDGSLIDYSAVRESLRRAAHDAQVELYWRRTRNHGKRYALVNAARQAADADIYVTVDSDSILDRSAIEEGLKPFADERVQSVAGFLLVLNYSDSWLSRLMELVIVSWGQFERSALSVAGSVLVNSGACAFYRAGLVREVSADFLSESIFGQPMSFSDDSLLTLFALERGRAVQQPTCFVFSAMPTTLRPHLVQQARWMRGAIVRAWWRFKYLPVTSVAYWALALKWLQFIVNTVLTLALVSAALQLSPSALAFIGTAWLGLQLAISSRYLALRRSDQTTAQRWGVYALVPLLVFWQAVVLHQLRLYAYATFGRMHWGSRSSQAAQPSRRRSPAPSET